MKRVGLRGDSIDRLCAGRGFWGGGGKVIAVGRRRRVVSLGAAPPFPRRPPKCNRVEMLIAPVDGG